MTLDAAENRCAVSKVIRKHKETEEVIPRLQDAIFDVTFAQHFIPDGDQVEKLLRYETATERSLDRALNRLERLQRRRLGEPGLRRCDRT